jgi:hypothetical protein
MYTYSESGYPKVTTTGKVVLDGDGLRLMNGTESSNATREVNLSNKGLVWRDGEMAFEANAVLFTLTVYQVMSTSSTIALPYAKMAYNVITSYPGIVSRIDSSPFDYVNIYTKHYDYTTYDIDESTSTNIL